MYRKSWKYKLMQPLWKTVWKLLKNLKIEWSKNPTLGIYPKGLKSVFQRDCGLPYSLKLFFLLLTIVKTWKHYKCPSMNKCIKKRWYIHTVGYHSGKNPAICSNTDVPGGHYANWNKPDMGQILRDTTYMKNLKQLTS